MRRPPQWSGLARLPGLEGRLPDGGRDAVVLTTAGSLGDLYPVLSVARALEAAGIEARLALSPDDVAVARRWGLDATPIGPSAAEIERRLGLGRDEIAASVLRDPSPILRDLAIPMAEALVYDLAPLVDGAGAVAATLLALSAPLAAERAGVPFVPLALQPMLTFAPSDPPGIEPIRRIVVPAPGRLGRAWNRAVLRVARAELSRRHRGDLDALRARLGLPPGSGTPLVDDPPADLRIGLWDPDFAPAPPDGPPGLEVVGFPPAPPSSADDPAVARWMEDGAPALVVTLGSAAHRIGPRGFWAGAVDAARRLGMRAVLLHGEAAVPEGPDILAKPYAAHAALFPLAGAILHHGGIGTTAEALRAGKPQLVMPVGGDQPDNAARLRRMGAAAVLAPRRFSGARAAQALHGLLAGFDHEAAQARGARMAARDGAAEAALRIARVALRS